MQFVFSKLIFYQKINLKTKLIVFYLLITAFYGLLLMSFYAFLRFY